MTPRKAFLLAVLCLAMCSCTSPEERDLKNAQNEVSKGYHRTALSGFDRVLRRAPRSESALVAARDGAKAAIFDLKDYKKAVDYLRHLILNSKDANEREQVQKQLASIYFEHLQDYAKAAAEFNRLLAMNPPFAQKARYKISIARSNFYLGKFDQAESEIEDLLKERLEAGLRFDALALKGNILVAKKNFSEAAILYRTLMTDFPERSQQENIGLQLAVCYEENQDFRAALSVFEGLRDQYQPREYIELRMKRLQERIRNQPGAKGYRK